MFTTSKSVDCDGFTYWTVVTEDGEILADFYGEHAQQNAEYFSSRLNGGPK